MNLALPDKGFRNLAQRRRRRKEKASIIVKCILAIVLIVIAVNFFVVPYCDQVLCKVNNHRAFYAKSVQTYWGNIPILGRDLKIDEILNPDSVVLKDGRTVKIKHIVPPANEYFQKKMESLVSCHDQWVHGPLTPIDEKLRIYEGDLFYWKHWAGCGLTPGRKRIGRWQGLSATLISEGICAAKQETYP